MSKEAQNEEIRLLALDVPVGGQSSHLVCPFCNGGPSHERSFVIWREQAAVYYKCYRAKCPSTGGCVPSVASDQIEIAPPRAPRAFTGRREPLNAAEVTWIKENWFLTEQQLSSNRIERAADENRLYMPLFTLDGYQHGCVLRALDKRKPKTISYFESEGYPPIHFPMGPHKWAAGDTVMVVEDIASAIRLQDASQTQTCALLGTHFGWQVAQYLSPRFRNLCLALDADATDKAIKFRNEWGLLFRNFYVIPLSKDVKNMTPEELQQFVKELPQ